MTAVTNPFIVATSGSNFDFSGSKTLTFYNVSSEDISKTAGVLDLPMPTLDSDGKIVMDLMGTTREISLEGEVTVTDLGAGNLYKYAQDIAGLKANAATLVDGAQGSKQYTYTSEVLNRGNSGANRTLKVCVTNAKITGVAGNLGSLKYSVTLMEYGTLV